MLAVLLCFTCLISLSMASNHEVALEVQVGSNVILPCPSNDDNHFFQFWQLVGNEVVGPGNSYDKTKYKYEVLTGKLFIKEVSTAENGFYKCVSKTLDGDSLHVQSVELLVRKDWEEEFESDHETNLFRVLIVIGVLFCLLVIGTAFYIFQKNSRTLNNISRLEDEESPEEGPSSSNHGTYRSTTVPSSSSKFTSQEVHGIDNPVLDTDIPTALNPNAL